MKYTFEKAEKNIVKINIDFDGAEWKGAIKEAYEKNKSKYSLPGFRKGKVPMHLLVKSYGEGIFYDDAINSLINKAYPEILEKEVEAFTVVGDPSFDIKDLGDNGLSLLCEVPVKPEFTLGEYKGINFEKTVYNVKDQDIEDELARLRERNSRLVEVTDRAVVNGDTAVIDFSGSVDGVKFDGGTAEKYELAVGSGSFIPGFEEQIVGMNIGEEKDINVKFPDEYQAENLKGKDAVFAIKLHAIKVKELPEINDDFIKEATGTESVELYKTQVKERLEKQNASRERDELENQIITKICDNTTIEIPEVMIDTESDRMVKDFEYRLMYQGMKLDDYLKYLGKTKEEFKKEFAVEAEKRVKSQLVIGKLIKEENIHAEESEIDAKLEEMAKAQGKTLEELKKNLDPRQLEYASGDVVITKLFDFLQSVNTVTEKKEGAKKAPAKKATAKKAESTEATEKKAPAKKSTTTKKTTAKKDA